MPRSEYDDDEAYDSVDEDAELELSCALHDLAERVKMFEENMKGRLRMSGLACDDDDGEEIGEDIPEVDDDHADGGYGYASPKKQVRRRANGAKWTQAKQQDDDEEDDDQSSEDMENEEEDGEEDDGDVRQFAKKKKKHTLNNARNEWDERNEREELIEIKDNISKLLQGFKEQAKALEASNQ